MWWTLPAKTPLYRITRMQDQWADVLQGYGAYFGTEGRYNRVRQSTVYASEDPLVALSEFAWHTALNSSVLLGDRLAVAYPVVEKRRLWAFSFKTPIQLIDVSAPAAAHQFNYPAHAPRNPHPDRYAATQHLADLIQAHVPAAPHSRAEGIRAPALRAKGRTRPPYAPEQVVLFVLPAPAVVPQTLQQRAVQVGRWDVPLKRCPPPGPPPPRTDPRLAWLTPRCTVIGPNPIPPFAGRPGGKPIPLNAPQTLDVIYSPD